MTGARRRTPGLVARLLADLPSHGQATAFSAREVGGDEETALLAAARVAPSADNAQTWRFVTARSPATRARIGEALHGTVGAAVARAPLVIVTCGVRWIQTRARREQPFVMLDVPIAVTQILLQATELGLGCCWTLECDEDQLRRLLDIPNDVRVIAVLGLGWPA
jgi:nitroreductase